MGNSVINAGCPCCSAPLRSGGDGGLVCESCGNHFDADVMHYVDEALESAAQASDMTWQQEGAEGWLPQEQEDLHAYVCPSCGAEIVADATTAATQCVYCGNASILPGNLSGSFRPDAVIPFEFSKEDAKRKYKQFLAGKKLLPNDFTRGNKIEDIAGVYVPFWLFDCDTKAKMVYRAERSSTRTVGNEDVTTTEHYLVMRDGTMGFDQIPVDGSAKFADALMEAIEPFDYGKMQAFATSYMPGYQAERYDVDAKEAQPRANERVEESVKSTFSATVKGYDSVKTQSAQINLDNGKVRNVLFPVWMLNTRWEGNTYTFAMNGQSGKFVGNLPISKAKAWKWRAGLFFGSFAAILGIVYALCAAGGI